MKSIVCSSPGLLVAADIEKPKRLPGHTLVRIQRIGICGTDLHAFDGTQPYFTYPRILGHELAGVIAEADPDGPYIASQHVTIIPYMHCGNCVACNNGKENCCVHMQVLGVHTDGGMVEYVSVPTTHIIAGGELDLDSLSLVEPLAIGAHGIRRAAVRAGEFVLVAGAGPIGMGTMDLARIAGAVVIAIDVDPARLDYCRNELGIQHTINATDPGIIKNLQRITNGEMPAVVIDASGNLQAINQGFDYISHGGRYVLIGLQKQPITFSHPEFHKREATLMSSRNATRDDFQLVMNLMLQRQVISEKYITHRINFSDLPEKFSGITKANSLTIKTTIDLAGD